MFKKYFLALLLFSLAIRVLYVGTAFDPHKYIFPDTEDYYSTAEAVATGNFLCANEDESEALSSREPLWPFILAPFAKLFPRNYFPVRLFVSLLLTVSTGLFVSVLRYFVKDGTALFGGVLFLFYPFYFYFSGILIQEPLVTVLLVLLVWLICQYVSTGRRAYYLWLSANILALYYLRVTCIGLIPLLFLPFFVERCGKNAVGVCLAGWSIFILLLLPWGWRNSIVIGKFSLLTRVGQVGLPGNESAGLIDIQNGLLAGMLASIKTVPGNLLDYLSPSINNIISKEITSPVYSLVSMVSVTPLLLATMYALLKIRNKLIFLMYCVLILYSAPYILLFGQTRYRLPVDFIMIAFLVMLLNDAYLKISGFRQKSS